MGRADFTLTVLSIPDVGRGVGLAIVLQTPGGKTYLYDTGTGYPEEGGWAGDHNTGRDRIAPFLRERGIRSLDGVIISHAHYDHFGGLLWLVDHMAIGKLIDSGYEFPGACDAHYNAELGAYTRLRDRFKQRGAYEPVHADDGLRLDDALWVEVLAPPKTFFVEDHPGQRPPRDPAAHYLLNANSLMLRIQHGRVVFFLPGDIEIEDQRKFMLPFIPREKLACDILIAPGHGLHSASELADATRPKVTIASLFERWLSSCSARQAFAAQGGQVYVTGMHGDVQVTSDGERWDIRTTTPSCDAQTS